MDLKREGGGGLKIEDSSKLYSRVDVPVARADGSGNSLSDLVGAGLPCAQADGGDLGTGVKGEGLSVGRKKEGGRGHNERSARDIPIRGSRSDCHL